MATRRSKGDGSLRKRPDGHWEARYTVTDLSGEPVRKAVYGKTQKEVREKLKAVLADYDYFGYKEPEKVTLGEWMDSWLESRRLSLSQSTYTSYKDRILVIKAEMGKRLLRETETRHLQKFLNSLATKTKSHRAYASATIIKTKNVLNSALEQAVRERIIRYNPARDLKAPKLVQKEIRILTKDEQQKLIDSLECHRLKPLYLLALATGMRRGELLALTWDCIDFENRTISVKQSINRVRNMDSSGSYLLVTEPKSKAGRRTVPLVESLVPILQEHREKQALEQKKLGTRGTARI